MSSEFITIFVGGGAFFAIAIIYLLFCDKAKEDVVDEEEEHPATSAVE